MLEVCYSIFKKLKRTSENYPLSLIDAVGISRLFDCFVIDKSTEIETVECAELSNRR